MISLQNELISVKIDEQGAELKSLVLTSNNLEYMWSGDATYWGKTSPVLFPIVGSLVNNTYIYDGKEYHLPRHGFARDRKFIAEQINNTDAIFSLKYDNASFAVFPFRFELALHYQLVDSTLSCTYKVANLGETEMYFSIGGHPAFAVPLIQETNYTDYWLKFNRLETFFRHKLDNGLVSDETELLAMKTGDAVSEENAGKLLQLDPALFYEDAIVFKHIASDAVSLGCDQDHHGLKFDFPGFPYLGIWAAKDAPFVCIEPWCGVADHVQHDQQLESKEGIQKLGPNQKWDRTWSVTIY